MTLWRIRVAVPDDPVGRGALSSALEGQPVSGVRLLPGRPVNSTSSEFVVELPQDDGLTAVLSALHKISPQVFVSRAQAPESEMTAEPDRPRARYGV
jgi:hypothetical protein